ncbi:GtrA-like protein [compost metagenome]
MLKRTLLQYPILNELIIYGVIGVLTSSVDSLIFYYLMKINSHIYMVNFISINAGILLSFFLNSYLNFKKTDKFFKRAFSFFCVGYTGLLLSTLILYTGVELLNYSEISVKLISIVLVAMFQFVLNKLITFGKRF